MDKRHNGLSQKYAMLIYNFAFYKLSQNWHKEFQETSEHSGFIICVYCKLPICSQHILNSMRLPNFFNSVSKYKHKSSTNKHLEYIIINVHMFRKKINADVCIFHAYCEILFWVMVTQTTITIKINSLWLWLLSVLPSFPITSNCDMNKINLCHYVDHYILN